MPERQEFRDLSPPPAAHDAIASLDLMPDAETVPLEAARGRVLAERVDATTDVPGFDRASMHGYAVRAGDTFGADEADPAVLDIVDTVHAGTAPEVVIGADEAAEISTGAVLPEGANAVVMVERTDRSGDAVEVRTAVAPGDSVMFAGADIAAGERALGPGTLLTPREVGLLSALGIDSVPVRGRPAVGIVSTGDELVRPGGDLDHRSGQIHDVNSYSIASAVEEAGGDVELYPHVGDDYDAMEQVLLDAAEECDLVLSSGSTSASAVDVIYRVIEDRGDLLLHGVAVKPGKPMLVGTLGGAAYVGLPGYPVSALTIFRTFVAPAVRDAAGLPEPRTATVRGEMAVRERYAEGRMRFMPVGLLDIGAGEDSGEDRPLVYPVDKGSGATTSLVEADGVVEVPADTEYLDAGDPVEVRLFSPSVRAPTLLGVGEDDPALSRLLDGLERPRYLAVGSREGTRRLRKGVPDVAVVTGGDTPDGVDTTDIGGWDREWGIVVPDGNPDGIAGLADLVDDVRFVNRTTAAGLRATLDDALADLAEDRGVSRRALTEDIDGFGHALRAHESPPRAVAAGEADAGLGLRATAEALGLGFVPVGIESVRVLATPERLEKRGVSALEAAIDDGDAVFGRLPGIERRD
jgi:molybdenum cofactor synthesis domain-containing protein